MRTLAGKTRKEIPRSGCFGGPERSAGGGCPDLLKELMELFLVDVPLQLIVLRKAVDAGDVYSVERIVHTLKLREHGSEAHGGPLYRT